jgi:hypothetical protein
VASTAAAAAAAAAATAAASDAVKVLPHCGSTSAMCEYSNPILGLFLQQCGSTPAMWEYTHTLKVLPHTVCVLPHLHVFRHCVSIPTSLCEYSHDVGVLNST